MSDDMIMLTCTRCDNTWDVRLSELEGAERIVYRGKVEERTYRVSCPRCGTYLVVTLEIEEGDDG